MRRIFAQGGHAIMREVDPPEPRAGEVLVRTAFSTVSSGTELYILRKSARSNATDEEYPGSKPWVDPNIRAGILGPLTPRRPIDGMISLGYSLAGRVIGLGEGVTDVKVGDPVACMGSQCSHHAEIVAVPRNLVVPVPDGVSLSQAAFVTLAAISSEALRRCAITYGETVVLYGMGLLGLLAGQIANAAGYYVVGLDIDARRLELARSLGITDVHDPRETDPVRLARDRTNGFGADAVVLGLVDQSSEPTNEALRMTRQHARVVGLGLFGMDVDRDALNDRLMLRSIAYGPGRYDPAYEENNVDYPIGIVRWTENRNAQHALRLMAEGRLVTDPIPARIAFADAVSGYSLLQSPDRPPTVQFAYDG
jgi:threonine dehydrogenase-like Zn-dependent dehydrogenase